MGYLISEVVSHSLIIAEVVTEISSLNIVCWTTGINGDLWCLTGWIMCASGDCSIDCRDIIAPANILFIISLCTILLGVVPIIIGIPFVLAGCITLIVAVVRIVSTNKKLCDMNLTLNEFKRQWNQEEMSVGFTSPSSQEDVYKSFSSSLSKSLSNLSHNSVSNNEIELPKSLTNFHQRLPMPPRQAILN
ncbi:unnamed protein product [Heterobilharzia americana]|nr:unnamed protein product [Heterobilharzia americana]